MEMPKSRPTEANNPWVESAKRYQDMGLYKDMDIYELAFLLYNKEKETINEE